MPEEDQQGSGISSVNSTKPQALGTSFGLRLLRVKITIDEGGAIRKATATDAGHGLVLA